MNALLYNRVNVRLNAFKVDPVTSGIMKWSNAF